MFLFRKVPVLVVVECFLLLGALIMACWVGLPISALGAVVGLTIVTVIAGWTGRSYLALAWICSVMAWAGCVGKNVWDPYFAILTALIATAAFLNAGPWRSVAMAWAFWTGAICLVAGYEQNWPHCFYVTLAALIFWMICLRMRFRLPAWGVIIVNTCLLLAIGLPITDWITGPKRISPRTWANYYSYEKSHHNPAAFARWCALALDEEVPRLGRQIYEPTGLASPTYRLRPASHGSYFDSPIAINSKGFRGPEIPPTREKTYRIVALGESTTFGLTLHAKDKPWPELLETMIRDRLKPNRPVEVINAGVPGYNLMHNVARLVSQIFPLHPDMIISYHGYNGFPMLDSRMIPRSGVAPPVYHTRPLKLLGELEYRLKMLQFRRHYHGQPEKAVPVQIDPVRTVYADVYRKLIRAAATNHIQLVLANYCMAANSNSSPEVLAFYRAGFPDVDQEIVANQMHSTLVRDLAARYPGVCLVDVHPGLEGEHEKFTDLIHLTQEGRRQLAENIFAGIRSVLESRLKR